MSGNQQGNNNRRAGPSNSNRNNAYNDTRDHDTRRDTYDDTRRDTRRGAYDDTRYNDTREDRMRYDSRYEDTRPYDRPRDTYNSRYEDRRYNDSRGDIRRYEDTRNYDRRDDSRNEDTRRGVYNDTRTNYTRTNDTRTNDRRPPNSNFNSKPQTSRPTGASIAMAAAAKAVNYEKEEKEEEKETKIQEKEKEKEQVKAVEKRQSHYGATPLLQKHIENLRTSSSKAYRMNKQKDTTKTIREPESDLDLEKTKKRCAFAIIHFGSNPVYLELELYFFKMLRQYTNHDIIYLYSVTDTPSSFVDTVRPFVTNVVPYDDNQITYNVTFNSGYSNFNTLRTCNFIFAYTLEQYDTVCIIESDLVIMKPIDPIFDLKTPAVLTYYTGVPRLNGQITNSPKDVLENCQEMGRINGGVMLIKPSMKLFEIYKSKIPEVVQRGCKYPNETLFEYVNNSYYNLPIQYNLSHFLAKPFKLREYGLTANDIIVYHFNETKYKHLDIIKTPLDENGDNWLEIIQRDKKYEIKKLPILHYKNTVYDIHQPEISRLLMDLEKTKAKTKAITPVSSKKSELRPGSPLQLKTISASSSSSKKSSKKSKSSSKSSSSSSSSKKTKSKKPRCPKGTRRSKKTGNCEPYTPK